MVKLNTQAVADQILGYSSIADDFWLATAGKRRILGCGGHSNTEIGWELADGRFLKLLSLLMLYLRLIELGPGALLCGALQKLSEQGRQ